MGRDTPAWAAGNVSALQSIYTQEDATIHAFLFDTMVVLCVKYPFILDAADSVPSSASGTAAVNKQSNETQARGWVGLVCVHTRAQPRRVC